MHLKQDGSTELTWGLCVPLFEFFLIPSFILAPTYVDQNRRLQHNFGSLCPSHMFKAMPVALSCNFYSESCIFVFVFLTFGWTYLHRQVSLVFRSVFIRAVNALLSSTFTIKYSLTCVICVCNLAARFQCKWLTTELLMGEMRIGPVVY